VTAVRSPLPCVSYFKYDQLTTRGCLGVTTQCCTIWYRFVVVCLHFGCLECELFGDDVSVLCHSVLPVLPDTAGLDTTTVRSMFCMFDRCSTCELNLYSFVSSERRACVVQRVLVMTLSSLVDWSNSTHLLRPGSVLCASLC
jgi:hypothetical protein